MIDLLFYILKVIVCSALFAGCYWFMLRNERSYHWNRFYIVTSVVLSIIIPLLNIPLSASPVVMSASPGYIANFVIASSEVMITPVQPKPFFVSWEWFAWTFFASIVLFLLAKEVKSFIRILRLKRRSERIRLPEAVLYCTDDASAPFTFFRSIFWKKDMPVDSDESRCILRHELAHVRLGHSWDKTLMQLVCCLFWMNPFFMLFRRELELVHEFAADSESLDSEELSSLLLCVLYPVHYHNFTNRFFQSNIKRRIIMISKNTCAAQSANKTSKSMLRKMSIIPVALVAMYLFATYSKAEQIQTPQNDLEEIVMQTYMVAETVSETYSLAEQIQTPQNDLEEIVTKTYTVAETVYQIQTPQNDLEEIVMLTETVSVANNTSDDEIFLFALVDVKPLFNGEDPDVEFRRWANSIMVYPREAAEQGITGRVFTEFIVECDGSVSNVTLLRGVHPLLDNEVLRVLNTSPKWTPGKQDGQPARVRYQFPFSFML